MSSAHLEIALDKSRPISVRLEAWNRYEADSWAAASILRNLPPTALPREYSYSPVIGDRIMAILEAAIDFRLPRKAEPAGLAGTS